MVSRLLSGASWTLAARIVAAVAGIGTSALLARLLTVEEFGVYFMAMSVTLTGALIGQMGIHLTVVRFVATDMTMHAGANLRPELRAMALLTVMFSVIVGLMYSGPGGKWLADNVFHSTLLKSVVGMTAVWLVLRAFQTVLAQTLRGFHDIAIASIFDGALSSVILVTLLSLTLLNSQKIALEVAVALSVVAFSINVLVGLVYFRRHWSRLPPKNGVVLKKVARVSLPLWISSLGLGGITGLHLWVLSSGQQESEVALFGTAMQLSVGIGLPLFLINTVLQSTVASLYASGNLVRLERILRVTATFAAVPALILLLVLVIFAGPILVIIYGQYYAVAAPVLVVLLTGQAVNILTGSPGMLMAMAGRQQALMVVAVLSGLAGLIVTYLMVASAWGAVGAATGLATSLCLQNIAMSTYCWRFLGVKTIPTLELKSFIIGRARLGSDGNLLDRLNRIFDDKT